MTPMEFVGAFSLGFFACFALMWWIGGNAEDK